MTTAQFDSAYAGFCGRRAFRTFLIEFTSGNEIPIGHPEAVRRETNLYVMRRPDGGHVVFAAESVSRLLDAPTPGSS